jgi:hypothetical protein
LRAKIKTKITQRAKFPDRKIFAAQKYIHNSRRNLQTKKVKHTQSSRQFDIFTLKFLSTVKLGYNELYGTGKIRSL